VSNVRRSCFTFVTSRFNVGACPNESTLKRDVTKVKQDLRTLETKVDQILELLEKQNAVLAKLQFDQLSFLMCEDLVLLS
ncbi:hypothetical protein ACT453_40085, partial [Bacillus sp. D-CC]